MGVTISDSSPPEIEETAMAKTPSKGPEPITSPKIKSIASEALRAPSTVTTKQTQELGASVMAHIEPRKPNAPAPPAKKK